MLNIFMEWLYIIQNLGVLALCYFILREVIKLHLGKDLERFKKLHSERMVIYKEVFQMVCDLYDSMSDMVRFHGNDEGRQSREMEAFQKAQALKKYIERNELFFDKNTYQRLLEPYNDIDEKVWSEYHYSRALRDYDNNEAYTTLMKVWGHLQNESPKIKSELAETFRKELGIK